MRTGPKVFTQILDYAVAFCEVFHSSKTQLIPTPLYESKSTQKRTQLWTNQTTPCRRNWNNFKSRRDQKFATMKVFLQGDNSLLWRTRSFFEPNKPEHFLKDSCPTLRNTNVLFSLKNGSKSNRNAFCSLKHLKLYQINREIHCESSFPG